MSGWQDDIVYTGIIAALFLITVVVYILLKRYRQRESGSVSFTKVERWVDAIFATALIGALIFITVRYS